MPRKPMKPCGYPGCPNLTSEYYCPEHEASYHQQRYNRFKRDKEAAKKYDYRWKRLRALYIKQHPLCERCEKEGRLTPVEEVHHIVPVKQGGQNIWSNCMSLCQSCHVKIHKEMEKG